MVMIMTIMMMLTKLTVETNVAGRALTRDTIRALNTQSIVLTRTVCATCRF